MKRISILGSTGSIGTQTLDVARWRNYDVAALCAGKNADVLIEQIKTFQPELVACDESIAPQVRAHLPETSTLITGTDGANAVATHNVDTVIAAIPGIAGLESTVAALRAGKHVALANKEAMVVAGPLVWEVARAHGGSLTPVDSEHSALFQCLVGEDMTQVASLVLTASGGPFRLTPEDLSQVTPAQALKHPNWSMGSKVTIDSATLFNKGLEVLEAHFLFEIPVDNIAVVVHPQSLIHSFVRFTDGSIKAQIGPHDMRLPIQYSIEYPARPETPLAPLPLTGTWELHEPDNARFPSLSLAFEAARQGGVAPAALNAADEVAVEAFLAEQVRFDHIPVILERVLNACETQALSWDAIQETDAAARRLAREIATQLAR